MLEHFIKINPHFLGDLETEETFPFPYDAIVGYFYGMYLSGLFIESLLGIKDRKPINIDGNNCLFLGMDDYIDDFQGVYGYEYALKFPSFYFSFGFEPENQIIVSEKEAFEAAVFVGKKFIGMHPEAQNRVNETLVLLHKRLAE